MSTDDNNINDETFTKQLRAELLESYTRGLKDGAITLLKTMYSSGYISLDMKNQIQDVILDKL